MDIFIFVFQASPASWICMIYPNLPWFILVLYFCLETSDLCDLHFTSVVEDFTKKTVKMCLPKINLCPSLFLHQCIIWRLVSKVVFIPSTFAVVQIWVGLFPWSVNLVSDSLLKLLLNHSAFMFMPLQACDESTTTLFFYYYFGTITCSKVSRLFSVSLMLHVF